MVRLWALSGKMGSGKSTVARAIVGPAGHVVSFATQLKKMVAKHLEISEPHWKSNEFKEVVVACPGPFAMVELPRPVTKRQLDCINWFVQHWFDDGKKKTVGYVLQIVGQAFRDQEDCYWIKALQSSEEWEAAMMDDQHDVVIDDLRYQNEYIWIKMFLGATILRAVAKDDEEAKRGFAGRRTTHASETDLDLFEFPITVATDPKEPDEDLRNRVFRAVSFVVQNKKRFD